MRFSIAFFLSFLLFYPYANANNYTLTFPKACVKGEHLIFAAVGDVLLHGPLQIQASSQGFESLWLDAIPYIKFADISYANLEGPIAKRINRAGHIVKDPGNRLDNNVYSGFPLFNYPPSLATALKNSGIDIVSTANNHILDRHSLGINKTLEVLTEAKIASVGTRKRDSNSSWITILKKGNFELAFISCTEHTNGNEDNYKQVLYCYKKKDRGWIIQNIHELKNKVDAIFIFPHWGTEYETHPNERQINFAHEVLNAGATAVIGSHPHVLQPMEKYITNDNRVTFILYSLGNFVSYQGSQSRRATIILLLGLTKTAQGTFINGIRFVPMYMENRLGTGNISLKKMFKDDNTVRQQIIYNILPIGNILFSQDISTNPECNETVQRK